MARYRPAGFSDSDDSSEEDYGFSEKPPKKNYYQGHVTTLRKKIENNLQDAIIHENMKEIEKIVACEFFNNVNFYLESGWTALMHASFHAQLKAVQLLLSKGANPNLHSDSITPIMVVCSNSTSNENNVYNVVTTLISKGSVVNVSDKHGQTPLMRAIASGRKSVVRLLLEQKANIEMRDLQGWTAVFWAAHHNKPEILEMLVACNARLTEVDKSGRTPLDIAVSHNHEEVINILEREIDKIETSCQDEDIKYLTTEITSWQDFYPGVSNGMKPNYRSEIPHLLYGMNCIRLAPLIQNTGMDLKTFLLLDDDEMIKLGIDMPYERQRLRYGLHSFHTKVWQLTAVAGLYACKIDCFSMLDCLTTFGNHLQQLYVLDTTLHYIIRELRKNEVNIRLEPPDSEVIVKANNSIHKMQSDINRIKKEIKSMKELLIEVNKYNPPPANLIKEKSIVDMAMGYFNGVVMVVCLGVVVYHTKSVFNSVLSRIK